MVSKCVKCAGMMFEVVEQSPRDSVYKMLFVQCFACKTPVGVVPYINTNSKVEALEKRLKDIEATVGDIHHTVRGLRK